MTHHFENALIGEALVGEGPEIAHIDLVIGRKGMPLSSAAPAMGSYRYRIGVAPA